ncbi:MAG: subunit of carbon monoxide dehydrogenase [Dehalococcoidia bacterium]|nr:subunit of carbon monoxide dehydrogenase [Dehalococcoidia bacterium]
MKIERTLKIAAPIDKVWCAIMDVPSVAALMPGLEKIEKIDDKTYKSTMKSKVAGVPVSFELLTTITEMEAPSMLKTVTDGKALGGLGRVSQNQTLRLKATSDCEVEVNYEADVMLVGRLGTFGERIFRAKATEMGDRFIEAFIKKVCSL